MTERVKIFTRFERFWHWTQAALIIFLLLTGFDIHGTYDLFAFYTAVNLHTGAAIALIVLWIFAIFWHFTTGEWKQYIPTTEKVVAMVRYYSIGIFTDAPHPVKKTRLRKHNPLQRLSYLFFKLIISPVIWISGIAYLSFNYWAGPGTDAGLVALIHTAAAFAMAFFLIVHAYMTTTGETVFHHIKAMITGYDEVESDEPARETQRPHDTSS